MGIDTCPMEGVNSKGLDTELGLLTKGYNALAVVSFGYRMENDFNIPSNTPKAQLAE